MNCKILLLLCLNAALVHSQFLSIPLLAVTNSPGTIALVTAVIGALKLGAAAVLAKTSFRGRDREVIEEGYAAPSAGYGAPSTGYGAPSGGYDAPSTGYGRLYRQRRDTTMSTRDSVFNLVSTLDLYSCGKSLVCELETKDALSDDEKLILSLFSNPKEKEYYTQDSPAFEYEMAANLGLASKNSVVCRQRFSKCPYTADEMMAALRNSNL